MDKVLKVLKQEYMRRPIAQLCFYKALAVALLTALWYRFLNHGVRDLGFGLTGFGVVLVCASWFSFLGMDDKGYFATMRKYERKKEPKIKTSDMIDWIETDPENFVELEKYEKHVAQLVSSLGMGLVFVLIGSIVTALS